MPAARPNVNAGDIYECANCHGTFVATRDDAECLAEQEETWTGPPGDSEVICDDCYDRMIAWARASAPELLR